MLLLFEHRLCAGERVEIVDQSVDFCSLRYLTGEDVNNRVLSAMVPGGLRVEFWKDCGGGDASAHYIENRDRADSRCFDIPVGMSHVRLTRHA